MSTATTLITAEEYAQMPDTGRPTELVRGEVVEMNIPKLRHGQVCSNIVFAGRRHDAENDCMHVVCNDSGVVTERNPDTVRGPDVSFIRYEKVPKGPLPFKYLEDVVPDVVFEVLSPDDRPSKVLAKVAEYLDIGVPAVCVLDPDDETVQVFSPEDRKSQTLSDNDELTFPEVLPGFAVRVGELFE